MTTGGSSAQLGARVDYFIRLDPHAKPGSAAGRRSPRLAPRHHRVVAWVSGESSMTTAVRRILVKSGVAKADISFHGYFKFGKSQYDD